MAESEHIAAPHTPRNHTVVSMQSETGKEIARFDAYPPDKSINECTLHYENHDVEDIYRQWDDLVPEDQRELMERFVVDFVQHVHDYATAVGTEAKDLDVQGKAIALESQWRMS